MILTKLVQNIDDMMTVNAKNFLTVQFSYNQIKR